MAMHLRPLCSSHVYRALYCESAASMKAENRVAFKIAGEAEAAGYRRAGGV
jgi:hypothetical protein